MNCELVQQSALHILKRALSPTGGSTYSQALSVADKTGPVSSLKPEKAIVIALTAGEWGKGKEKLGRGASWLAAIS